MIRPKNFGKLGNRKAPRIAVPMDANLMLPERSAQCQLVNVSRTGCRLALDMPPRIGATVLVRIERIETLGVVAWVKRDQCGITFEAALDSPSLERLRWILDHSSKHQQNSLSTATAVWR
jgi:hypothetical protein